MPRMLLLVLLLLVVSAGCSSANTGASTEPPVTPTVEIIPLGVPDEHTLSVIYALEGEGFIPANTPPAEPGFKWVVIRASISNATEAPLTVDANTLALLAEDDERYAPAAPDAATQPPLVGAVINGGASFDGVIRFAIPEAQEGILLEWCPQTPCDQPIQSPLP